MGRSHCLCQEAEWKVENMCWFLNWAKQSFTVFQLSLTYARRYFRIPERREDLLANRFIRRIPTVGTFRRTKKKVVISTHKGLFRYNRLPFGIKTAPGIFQKVMNKMVTGLHGELPISTISQWAAETNKSIKKICLQYSEDYWLWIQGPCRQMYVLQARNTLSWFYCGQ